MGWLRRLAPKTITAQIACLVIVAVVLGVGLASGVLMYLFYASQAGSSFENAALVRAARIAAIVKEAQAAASPAELERALKGARRHNPGVQLVPVASLSAAPSRAPQNPAFASAIRASLEEVWGIVALPDAPAAADRDAIAVPVADDKALVFELPPPHPAFRNFVLVQTTCALAIVLVIILFLSLYAVRWITSPLSSIASAARSFGHSSGEDRALSQHGPREIAQVAEALNDMRKRVRSLVDERTQMLVAISHDLRTPLTRLRLRAERLGDANLRNNMLADIAIVNDMLGETLVYLREGGRLEPVHRIDLPSLLQTICAQFSDIGHDVTYQGPDRFAFACRAHALNRAVTNVVDNGAKHGASVTVTLSALDDSAAQIEVSDDGPGIADALREKVFEPFFKGDSARPSSGRAGFGLGLSIARDIVRRHGGDIDLSARAPHGLTVRLTVAAQPGALIWNFARPAEAGAASGA